MEGVGDCSKEFAPLDALVAVTTLPKPPERPIVLYLIMVGWIALPIGVAFLIGFVIGILHLLGHNRLAANANMTLRSWVCLQTGLVLAAWHRAGKVGWQGSRTDGFGDTQTRHWWLVGILMVAFTLWAALGWAVRMQLIHVHAPLPMSMEVTFAAAEPVTRISFIVMMTLAAPVAEELFFRGWLWTGLRRFWKSVPVMFGTAIPWFVLHGLDDYHALLPLLPLAIALSIVRHFCGIRASIALHAVNNAARTALFLVFYGLH
jgi:membrane protease YdiL (CAAX protease family)